MCHPAPVSLTARLHFTISNSLRLLDSGNSQLIKPQRKMLAVFNVRNKVGFNRKCAGPLLLPKTERCSTSSKSGADVSRCGRWQKERKAEDKISSKMFILFSKTKEKTNAYGRRDTLLHCDSKQWGLSKTWTWFLKLAQPKN